MKESPQNNKLEALLRSSKLVAGGFMGSDNRGVLEIIDADKIELSRLGFTCQQLASRMRQITDAAKTGLETWVQIDDNLEAKTEEARGFLPCPWPHAGRFVKRVTIIRRINTSETIQWSDLNIHLIGGHGFFQGRGSNFRIEPAILIKMIF
ncbi:MAG: hypothetical protein JW715_01240 [Sedimentisphaerales bacterium]|nr:hypothetical protein [Sedimentisphaerales bacterium]